MVTRLEQDANRAEDDNTENRQDDPANKTIRQHTCLLCL